MTKEQLEAVLDVFTSKGWKIILEHIDDSLYELDSVRNCSTAEEFWKLKGAVEQMNWFLRIEDWYQYIQDNQEGNE